MTRLDVSNMTCGHCKSAVTKAIASVDPDAVVTVDLPGRTVDVESNASDQDLLAAVKAEGYDATLAA